MISYQWYPELGADDRAEVLALVERAAGYDEEAGFSSVAPARVTAVDGGHTRVLHLPVKARRDLVAREDAPLVVVAYLNLQIDDDGLGTVHFVVDPDYRSRGVATMLAEEIGLDVDADGGWAGTGAVALRCWAYATHPAADRLARRFGIDVAGRLWSLFRHLSGPFADPLPPVEWPDGFAVGEPADLVDAGPATAAVLGESSLARAHRDRLADRMRSGSGRVVAVTDAAGTSAGFVWYDPEPFRHLELKAASLHGLVLADAARGIGLGTALVVVALHELADAGTQLALVRIDPDDAAAVRMFRLLSFEQEDEHSCFQVGDWPGTPGFHDLQQ